jgi:membrane associated rhomboid family serine protease
MTDLVEVGRSKTLADAKQQVLVLAAAGIECHLMGANRDIGVYVASTDVEQAVQELACYERENQFSWLRPRPARLAPHAVDAALAYCAVLLFFFGAARRHALSVDWAAIGAAQASLIRDGAWWRTFTALSLHADVLHLMSNVASGVIFGLFVARLLGSGLAWLTMLMAGALGNALIALVQAPEHTAIGASTGIFGAVGILTGYMWRSRIVPWRGGLRRWAPLGAGIMLLVFLGFSGERTDIGAHVAGFAVGGVMGFILAPAADRLENNSRVQWASGALACGLFFLAWLLALRSAG